MKFSLSIAAVTALLSVPGLAVAAPVAVNSDNFTRAESDLYFTNTIDRYGFGKLGHERNVAPVDAQPIIRLNRDTLYSGGVFDLDAGPVTLTLPDPGDRFLSLQIIDEDHFTHGVYYGGGKHVLTRDDIGTRYVFVGIRTLANPNDPADLDKVHALQDAMKAEQSAAGSFAAPDWDAASRDKTRSLLLGLAALLPDTKGMFGARDKVDPIRHLIGTAMGWGGNPETEALYLNRTAPRNDGKTVYRVTVGDVPVDGFWSITVYNAKGFLEPNPLNAYSLNNLTAKKADNGDIKVQFGGCDGKIDNCLPVPDGWNWMVRLYRPHADILDGSWVFPDVEEAK
ncbi:carboxylesterase [Kaistia algarum]|uniref:DUF1254 domain-containing protein n=1 Tax=Kaistia algarum TaxID=2083279 RepID=UPI000CE731FB|nr:DUF1254 domain-containing protein [Kaistia algarum]MCX5515758.1 DUF1254 domain-containing protein [Kaistia algarum]PPE80867.1 carboxylesterase [Kaistia algarum]